MTQLHGRIAVIALFWFLALFSHAASAFCEETMSGPMQMSSSQNCQTLPPPMPGQAGTPSITAVAHEPSDYTINWQAASNMIVGDVGSYGYQLLEYRDGVLLRTVQRPASSTSFSVSNASAGVYTYKVRGCNSDSQYTMVVCGAYSSLSAGYILTFEPEVPAAPPSVWVPTSDDDGDFVVSWQASSGDVTDYSYATSPDFSHWLSVGTATSVSVSGLTDGDYGYRVRACNTAGCSVYASSNTVTVNHPVPTMPGAVSVPAQVSESSYVMSWQASTSLAADSYQVAHYHNLNGWSSWQPVTAFSTTVTVSESGDWQHRVRACNQLPDMTYKCSDARQSSVVDVQLPAPWAVTAGQGSDALWGHVEGLQADDSVGAVQGQGGVSGGAATYSIPIVVPPGRAGMQPSVQLSYSSRVGQGVAGVGWQLSAGSGIARCSATMAQDGYSQAVKLTSSDKLCLDGQRLMVVSGSYGQAGAVYRLERDTFTRVSQTGALGPNAWFTVEDKQHITRYYGTSSASKQVPQGVTQPLVWGLSYETDSAGNSIHYNYQTLAAGDWVLASIDYTGMGQQRGDRRVEFTYAARSDVSRQYLAGGLTVRGHRLQSIQTYTGLQSVRSYHLSYRTSAVTGRSLLSAVAECSAGVCLPATEFSSYDEPLAWDQMDSSSSANQALSSLGSLQDQSRIVHQDVNGDGVQEVLYLTARYAEQGQFVGFSVAIYQRLTGGVNAGDYQLVFDGAQSTDTIVNGIYYYDQGDLNGDGITDFFIVDSAGVVRLLQFDAQFNQQPLIATGLVLPASFVNQPAHVGSTLELLDVTGDGYQDISFIDDDDTLYYYRNNGTSQLGFSGPYALLNLDTYVYGMRSYRQQPSYQDIDGDGVVDIILRGQNGVASDGLSVAFGRIDGAGLWQLDALHQAAALGLPSNQFHHHYEWADINGDGRLDYVRAGLQGSTLQWQLAANRGNRSFAPLQSLASGLGLQQVGIQQLDGYGALKVQPLWGGLRIADLDNDGADELLVATDSDDTVCVTFVGTAQESGAYEPYSTAVCNDDLHAPFAAITSHPGQNIAIDWSQYDTRRFYWSLLDFSHSAVGTTIGTITADVVNAPISSFTVRDGRRASGLSLKDVDNNGTIDFTYQVLPAYSQQARHNQVLYVAGTPYYQASLSMNYSTQGPAVAGGYYEQLNLLGTGANRGYLADTVHAVTTGLGQQLQWRYAPLSAWLDDRHDGGAFYQVPAQRYIANDPLREHFYFTSSMYVVSDHFDSDGIGGLRQLQYQYREAIYHRGGRGFQGFRRIIVDDLGHGSRAVSDFHQIFPLAGELESVSRCLLSDTLGQCESQPLSQLALSYQVKQTTHADTWWVYPSERLQRTFDVSDRSVMLQEQISRIGASSTDVDDYGNVLYREDEHFNGFTRTKTTQQSSYAVDTVNWWLNKPVQTRQTSVTLSRDSSVGAMVLAGSDPQRWQQRDYSFDSQGMSYRKPTTVTVTASDSSLSHSTQTQYNSYGLPTLVTQSGQGVGGSDLQRSESFGYSADGYFVTSQSNDLGHQTSWVVAAAHGQVVSQTDANGVTSTRSYDGFGRLQHTSVPGAQAIEQGYQWCVGQCPVAAARYYQFTQQAGSPTVRVYKDLLNRPVYTQTDGFGGQPVYQAVQYNALGQTVFESVPSYTSTPTEGTHYRDYDVLGRLLEKAVDREYGNEYVTQYSYQGHDTLITVTDGITLSLQRTYASDGKLIQTIDAQQGVTRYAYDSAGNPLTLEDANGAAIYAQYNGFGHKVSVQDPNMGASSYVYNSFAELVEQQDANGDVLKFRYDGLGRLLERRVNQTLQASFSYDSGANGIGLPASETAGGMSKSWSYDSYSRALSQNTSIDGSNYTIEYAYDSQFGRLKSMRYPSGITVAYGYDAYGYQTLVSNAASGFVYQQISARDARQNLLAATKNNGTLNEQRSYNPSSGQLEHISAVSGSVSVHDLSYSYGSFGNLASSEVEYDNGSKSTVESYLYDDLHRLVQSSRSFNGISHIEAPIVYQYDAVGNLTEKSDFASFLSYGSEGKNNAGNAGPNAVQTVNLASGGLSHYSYDNNGNRISGDGNTISYNAFNKPVTISTASSVMSFSYGADGMRYKQVKSSAAGVETTHYIDKIAEVVISAGVVSYRSYIDDIAIVTRDEVSGQALDDHRIRYTHRDRLGSVISLTDHNNLLMEHRSYDPFGKPRHGNMQDPLLARLSSIAGGTPFTQRGFTDHEHLDDAELIHMNGRVYDYNLGRFLSVDPFIQGAENTQSINPYSYILNNPMAGTDPTGYLRVCDTLIICSQKQIQDENYNKKINLPPASKSNGNETSNDSDGDQLDPENIGAPGELGDSAIGESPGLYHIKWNSERESWENAGQVEQVNTEHAAINGMLNELDYAIELMGAHVQHAYGRGVSEFTLFHNPTKGSLADGWESFRDKIGWTTDIAKQFSGVLSNIQSRGMNVNWVAHSQGGIIFSEAVRYSGDQLPRLRVAFHAGGNNRWVTNRILKRAGVYNMGYLDNPYDPVPNIGGLNTLNPIKIFGSLIQLPRLAFGEPQNSPHTLPYVNGKYER